MFLAPMKPGERLPVKIICEKADIPESFTRKVFQDLVNGGFLEASRGPGGGYSLAHDPNEISLLEVIEAVDGDDTFAPCIMGLPVCDAKKPCPVHATWSDAKAELIESLHSKTLQELVEASASRRTRKRSRK